MNEQQAMNLVSEVCAKSNGDLNYHQLVQEALNIVMSKAFPAPVKETSVPNEIVGPKIVKPDFKKDKTETVAE